MSGVFSIKLEPLVLFHFSFYMENVFIVVLLSVYMIKLGTLENESTADVEWRHHAYTHTAKKRRFLSVQ